MICSTCSESVPVGARFCPACGGPARAATGGGDALQERLQSAVQGSFRIERLLGRGGMGSVYLAREPALDRQVAIKVLPPERAESSELKERFRREARTAAQLSHPNIVPLLTFGEGEGLMYFVMGYVEGEVLSLKIRREGRLQTVEAVRILSELAQALTFAHSRGVVHRDVKPENILLESPHGLVKLTDFGVARGVAGSSALTSEGAIIGTPHYMSPEQAAGRPDIDVRSDIYSMGALAYTLFVGRPPFTGRSASDILRQHLSQDPPRLRQEVPELPQALDDAVRRCLAKDPGARFPSAADFARALESAGDSWWGSLMRKAGVRSKAPTLSSPRAETTPMPQSPLEFVAAATDVAAKLQTTPFAGRLRAQTARLASEMEALDRAIIGLQAAADPVDLRRLEKRLSVLRSIADPGPEILATIHALGQLQSASHVAADRLEVVKSTRASVLGSLRRLHGAARRLAGARGDLNAAADFEDACRAAASDVATQVRDAENQETRAPTLPD